MDSQRPVRVVVDDRESKSGIPGLLSSRYGVAVRIQRPPLGDYRVDETLLFDRSRHGGIQGGACARGGYRPRKGRGHSVGGR